LAKPAVPFGGRCRIIDYTLSNCVHSGIETIGVLTQYQSESLHNHIGDGKAWRKSEGVQRTDIALLPSSRVKGGEYLGTADAIYQNIDYIDHYSPEHILVLSGDHIYQMDYTKLMDKHIDSGAAATIAVKRVPWKDASRFGVIHTDESDRILDFVEKPRRPESNLASMGIYMFRWADLRSLLVEDHGDKSSSHDFAKDIIPRMLQLGLSLGAHPFEGYWRDVGTVDSLWEAHMDFIAGDIVPAAETPEGAWPIISRDMRQTLASYVCPKAEIRNSFIQHGSSVEGDVDRSVIFGDVAVGRGADIRESIIMPGARIGRNAWICRAIIGEGAVIEDGAVIGSMNGDVTVVVAEERLAAPPRFVVTPCRLPNDFFEERDLSVPMLSYEKGRS
jgi:glucose-1-phosphate adenylyltransferase